MIDNTRWNIIQYNVNKSKDKVQHHFLQELNPEIHQVITIQEPWLNPNQYTTAKHPAYHLVFPQHPGSRTCIYVSKRLDTAQWRKEDSPEGAGGDVTSISLQTAQGKVWVHSLYNPPPGSHQSTELGTLKWIPEMLLPQGHHIITGDFNLHHPRWGGQAVQSHHSLAEGLIETMQEHQMDLITPEGLVTWKTRGSQSTLDLAFTSPAITSQVLSHQVSEELESSSDHLPICTQLTLMPRTQADQSPRPQWKKANWEQFKVHLEKNLQTQTQPLLDTRQGIDQRVDQITGAIQLTVEAHIPAARPSQFAKGYWTRECSQAVKEARRARRVWTEQGTEESWIQYHQATSRKKKQIKRDKNQAWRVAVAEAAKDPKKIWKLGKWARKNPEEANALPQVPDIKDKGGTTQTTEAGKAQAMAEHFFPAPVQADTQDIPGTLYGPEVSIQRQVLNTEVEDILKDLPSDKAPGPDGIPNRLLKHCREVLGEPLAELFNACLAQGYHPKRFKESNTIVLRKPQKERYDVPKAYRPIALLNTMGKALEKIVAQRISEAAETYNLLPEEQMGARPKRSTLSAIELLTEQVYTIWGQDKGLVASMLSLDISGAFDNVSHKRLIHNIRLKGIPKWITRFTESFLQDRSTSIHMGTYKGEQIPTDTGIPQGSTLSPILFLFFVGTLLPLLQTPRSSAGGFVDDTNILAWSKSTEENCRILENQHEKCEAWAKTHGVKFAPEKYQLIHFTRKRKKHNLKATVHIQGCETKPVASLRLLGVFLDPKLKWGAHIKQIQQKAITQTQSLTRLTHSTWGATFDKAKIVYDVVVRTAITYGGQVWAQPDKRGQVPSSLTKPIQAIQTKCLRTITGAYKSTSTRVLHHETATLPIDLYLKQLRIQYAHSSLGNPVQRTITRATEKIRETYRGRRRQSQKEADTETLASIPEGGPKETAQGKAKRMAFREWENRWMSKTRPHPERATPPADPRKWKAASFYQDKEGGERMNLKKTPSLIHKTLKRAQSSIATQIRSGHVGLNSYLYRRQVPGIESPRCQCGYQSQNVKHMIMQCPRWAEGRAEIWRKAKIRSFQAMMDNPEDVKRITQWILDKGWMEQFRLTEETEAIVAEREKERKRSEA